MKNLKKLLLLTMTIAMVLVPSMTAAAQPPLPPPGYEIPEISEPELAPPICIVPKVDDMIVGYGEDDPKYLALVDIATGQYFEGEATLEAHKIYAGHVYLENNSQWNVAVTTAYSCPSEISADTESSINLAIIIGDYVLAGAEVFQISANENLQLQMIPQTDAFNGQIMLLAPGEVKELDFFFQTIAEGAEPIAIADREIVKSLPVVGDLMAIVGVPCLAPTSGEGNPDGKIGDTICGLPMIIERSYWTEPENDQEQ